MTEGSARARVGLCTSCSHARVIRSAKGSEFWLCELGKADPRFNKYPRLPVLACPGFKQHSTPSTDR